MRTDCRQYRISQPCVPHKETGARCTSCVHYDPVCERVLIVKLSALGDVLRTTTCLEPLKARYPRSHVTWITRNSAVPLLQGNAWVDRILSLDSNYLPLLLSERFDVVIAPDADPLSAAIAALVQGDTKLGFIADGRGGIQSMNAVADEWWRLGLDDHLKRAGRRTYGEWLYGICGFDGPVARPTLAVPEDAKGRALHTLRRRAPQVERWVCFNTGGSGRWEQKRWNRRYYAPLASLVAAGDPSIGVVLVGGPEETALNRELLLQHPTLVDGGTSNSLVDFAALLSISEWVLTGDTLGYHLACAVGTPACCLVGPTSPWELDTYGDNIVLHAEYDCIACYRATCPLAVTCMDALPPELVWTRIREWHTGLGSPRLATA